MKKTSLLRLHGCLLFALAFVLDRAPLMAAQLVLEIAQEAYLKASNTGRGDQFGKSVAVSGETVVIGAPSEAGDGDASPASGAVYVFARVGGNWVQQAYLKSSEPATQAYFGSSVAIDGNRIVVGAPAENGGSGTAYIFGHAPNDTNWSQLARLTASNASVLAQFGHSVAISGETVVVGAVYESSSGVGVNSSQNGDGAPLSGAAYVFVFDSFANAWPQQAYLKASNAEADDYFGESVAVSGNTIVVGARREAGAASGVNGSQADNALSDAGAAYIFVREPATATWIQQAYLKASNPGAGDQFGRSVAVSGDTVVVGAPTEQSNFVGVQNTSLLSPQQSSNNASGSGAAYIFVRDGRTSTWTQQAYLKASNTGVGDVFGGAVGVSGNIVVVGARFESSVGTGVNRPGEDNGAYGAGAAYVFYRDLTRWSHQAYVKASNNHRRSHPSALGDHFGFAVGVSDGLIVAGAPFEQSNATGVNGPQHDNSVQDAGSAYIFSDSSLLPSDEKNNIYAFAGGITEGFSGDGGPATQALLDNPSAVAVDQAGNVYIADIDNHRVRRVGTNGVITTVAGVGTFGFSGDGGPATQAELYRPVCLAVDRAGNVYISDIENHRVRRVGSDGSITTFAGGGLGGDGGPANQAELHRPLGLAADGGGNIYIVEAWSNRVRRVGLDGIITTFAGTGDQGFSGDGGPATQAQLDFPLDLAVDGAGNLYIGDFSNNRIRRVGTDGIITTFAGSGQESFSGDGGPATQATMRRPVNLAVDSAGMLYFSDEGNHRIRRVDTNGVISTIAGNGGLDSVGDGGPALEASFSLPMGLAVDAIGNIYVVDKTRVRVIRQLPDYDSSPSPDQPIYFEDLDVGESQTETIFIRNRGRGSLIIDSIEIDVPPVGMTRTITTMDGRPATLPHTISPGFTADGLRVDIHWQFDGLGGPRPRLVVTSNDRDSSFVTYPISRNVANIASFEESILGLFWDGLSRLAQKERQAGAQPAVETATFIIDSSATNKVTTEIPNFLGSGLVVLSNFTGSVTVSLIPIPGDTNRATIRVDSGRFTAPSIQLPSGMETGPNELTFTSPAQSGGILFKDTGKYTAYAAARIVNTLIPSGIVVQGNYSGIYDSQFHSLSLRSESRDIFEVTGPQPALVISNPGTQTVDELTLLTVTHTASANNVVFALETGLPGMAVDPATGILTWTPTELQGPSANEVRVKVTDGSLSDTNSFLVIVREINTVPALTLPPDQTIDHSVTYSATATATDSDQPTNTLAFALVAGPAEFTINPTNGVITWKPSSTQIGAHTVQISLTDNGVPPLSATNSYVLTVRDPGGNVNHPPVFGPLSDYTLNPGDSIQFQPIVTDPDVPPQTLAFTIDNPPPGMTIAAAFGRVTWRVPAALANTTQTITLRATDNGTPNLSGTGSFTVTINPLVPVTLRALKYQNAEFTLSVDTGSPILDYVLQGSDTLANFIDLRTNTPAAVPFTFTNTSVLPYRFYRVRLSP